MTRAAVTEQQLAELVVAYLEAAGADVYQEVEVSGGVADIVARVRAEIWIVEVKTSLSLALIGQGMERRRLAHRVYLAAPAAIDEIKHHYASKSSARSHLSDLIGRGVVAGVELRRSHGTHGALELHPRPP